MRFGVLVILGAALAGGCQSMGSRGPGVRKKKRAKATARAVMSVSRRMARDMEIPLPFESEPDTHPSPADPESVVCKVVRVADGGATIFVSVPDGRDLVPGEEISIFMTVAPLPASRYLKDHKKELYIARATVVEGGEGECIAEINDLFAEGPVQPGDLAIARGY